MQLTFLRTTPWHIVRIWQLQRSLKQEKAIKLNDLFPKDEVFDDYLSSLPALRCLVLGLSQDTFNNHISHDEKDDFGLTALEWSIRRGDSGMARRVLFQEQDADTRKDMANDLIVSTARSLSIPCLDILLEVGGMLDYIEPSSGLTALHMAITRSRGGPFAKRLLEANVDVNLTGSGPMTPLMETIQRNFFHFAALLLDNGAVVDLRNDLGETAMLYAAQYGSSECMRLLIKHGADYSIRNNMNETILHKTAFGGKIEVFELLANLRMRDIDIHARANNGRTARDYLRTYNEYRPQLIEAFEALLLSVQGPEVTAYGETEDQFLARLTSHMPGSYPD